MEFANHLAGQRDHILAYIDGLTDEQLATRPGELRRWADLYRAELAELEGIGERLRAEPASVSQVEIDGAASIGRQLERVLLLSQLHPYAGSWVAVRGTNVVESADGPSELAELVRKSGKPVDLFFLVSEDGTLTEV